MPILYSLKDALTLTQRRLEGLDAASKALLEQSYAVRCRADGWKMTTEDREALRRELNALSEVVRKWVDVARFGDY
jgi:hypothetical protein